MIPITSLIPQRPPIVMIDTLLYCDRRLTQTSYTVAGTGLFVEFGSLSAVGLLENMAQTIAARMGYLAMYSPAGTGVIRVGVIGSIRNLTIATLPAVESLLATTVELQEEIGDMILVHAKITSGECPLAHCDMIVSLI